MDISYIVGVLGWQAGTTAPVAALDSHPSHTYFGTLAAVPIKPFLTIGQGLSTLLCAPLLF